MPHPTQAQCVIIFRRRSRSSTVRGTMNDIPTGSPDDGDGNTISSRVPSSCWRSYSAATDLTPPFRAGCAVTSFTRSPRIHTSGGLALSPSMYCCPVFAGMIAPSPQTNGKFQQLYITALTVSVDQRSEACGITPSPSGVRVISLEYKPLTLAPFHFLRRISNLITIKTVNPHPTPSGMVLKAGARNYPTYIHGNSITTKVPVQTMTGNGRK